jgi:uncharacterized protein (DUF4415 family)
VRLHETATATVAVKLQLNPDVIDGFKAGGPGRQTRISAKGPDSVV